MKDIADKVDALRSLEPGDKEANSIMADFIGEIVGNSRRIAGALEQIAENTKPVELQVATATIESKAFEIDTPLWNQVVDLAYEAGQSFKRGQQAG
jgi:hypothetical protein